MKVKQCWMSSEIKVVALNHPKILLLLRFDRGGREENLFCRYKNIATVCSRRQADLLNLRGVGPPLYPKAGHDRMSLPCALFAIVIGTGLR